jgi:hypothetical protein
LQPSRHAVLGQLLCQLTNSVQNVPQIPCSFSYDNFQE